MAYKPKVGSQMSTPNVIPMADIMLVLLIIFMVVTPMLQKGKQVDLASVNNTHDMQNADKDDAIIVAITRNGDIFLGTTKTAKDDLTNQIKDRIANRLDIVPKLPLPPLYQHVLGIYDLNPMLKVKLDILCQHHLTTYLYLLSLQTGGTVLPLDQGCAF